MSKPFDPYHTWLGIRPEEQPPNHYRLLGLQAFEDDPGAIENAADQRMAHLRSVQSGKRAEQSQKLLNEVVVAKLCLLDRDAKTNYDAKLRQRTAGAAQPRQFPVAVPLSGVVAEQPSPDEVPYAEPMDAGTEMDEMPGTGGGGVPAKLILSFATAMAIGLVVATVVGILAYRYFTSGGEEGEIAFRHEEYPPMTAPAPRPLPYRPTADEPGPRDRDLFKPPRPGHDPTDGSGTDTDDKSDTQPDAQADNSSAAPEPTDTDDSSEEGSSGDSTEATDTDRDTEIEHSSVPDEASADPPAGETVAATSRLTVPDRVAQTKILQQIEEIYESAAADTDTKRLELAQELYNLGGQSRQETGERFVVYRRAMELSCEAGDADLMLASIDAIGTDYEVETDRVRATMLERFLGKAEEPTRVLAFMKISRRAVDEAIESEAYDVAARISAMAANLCDRPLGSSDFRRGIRQRHAQVEEICRRHRQVADALKAIESNPDDAAARLIVGRWYCFDKSDWDEGLPHLARCGDEQLQAIATQELKNNGGTASAHLSLADAWWDLAEVFAEDERVPLLRRARYWYGQIDPDGISGIVKLKVEMRQQEISEQLARLDRTDWSVDGLETADDAASATPGGPASSEFNTNFDRAVNAALQEQDFVTAERLFSRCARAQPQHLPTLNNYALVSIRSRNYRRAIHLWGEAADMAPHSSVLRHNMERFRRLADGDPIKLDTSLKKDLSEACTKVGRSSHYRSSDGWLYLPANATASYYPNSSYEDRRCFYCNGTGTVDCPARGCFRGTVRSSRTDVVGTNTITGQPILKSSTTRVRCDNCYGRGKIDCDHCTGGISRSLY